MDWIVFGDDWGRHPSTTQHLIRSLPADDRVIWVNSVGMRKPSMSSRDLRRALGKLRTRSRSPNPISSFPLRAKMEVITTVALPWHERTWAQKHNRRRLHSAIREAMHRLGITEAHILASTPVAAYYLEDLPALSIGYLRLDAYPLLPGVDASLARAAESRMLRHSTVRFVTAQRLVLHEDKHPWFYLPQGVDWQHFASNSNKLPPGKTLGFFGALTTWINYDLIEEVARAASDWTLEFVGPVDFIPKTTKALANVRFLAPIPYPQLPAAIAGWRAVWMPFVRNALTMGVNPLKIREYLAAGLPTLSIPLPEIKNLSHVTAIEDSRDVVGALAQVIATDTPALRQARKDSVRGNSWHDRSRQLRDAHLGCYDGLTVASP